MSIPRPRSEAGISLLLALLAMTIVGGAAYRLLLHTDTYQKITHTFANSLTAQQKLRRQIDLRPTAQRGCATQRLLVSGRTTQDWIVCSRGNPPFLANHPISLPPGRVDYNSLFATPLPCPGQRIEGPDISATAPSSGTTCTLPAQLAQSLRTLDNIRCNELVVEKPDKPGHILIATAGSLICDGVLTLPAPTILVAGGDIRIGSVVSSSSSPINVTVLSAHGNVVVGSSSGPISILGLSRGLLHVPLSPAPEAPLLPPFITSTISGIRPSDAT